MHTSLRRILLTASIVLAQSSIALYAGRPGFEIRFHGIPRWEECFPAIYLAPVPIARGHRVIVTLPAELQTDVHITKVFGIVRKVTTNDQGCTMVEVSVGVDDGNNDHIYTYPFELVGKHFRLIGAYNRFEIPTIKSIGAGLIPQPPQQFIVKSEYGLVWGILKSYQAEQDQFTFCIARNFGNQIDAVFTRADVFEPC